MNPLRDILKTIYLSLIALAVALIVSSLYKYFYLHL